MAYTKTNWVDRVVDGSGAVIVEGTPVNATNMNKIENAIEDLQGKAYKISLPVSSWTGSGPYTYVYPATGMTSDTTIDYTIDSTIDNLNGDLTITTGVGTITFSTPSLPSGTVTVTVMAVGVDADIQLIDWSSYCYSKDQAVAKADIINNLTSTATNKPLSANMGKELNGKATKKMSVSGTTTSTGALLVNIPSGGIVVAIDVTSEVGKIALKRSGSYIHIYNPGNTGLEPFANAEVSVDIYYQIIE